MFRSRRTTTFERIGIRREEATRERCQYGKLSVFGGLFAWVLSAFPSIAIAVVLVDGGAPALTIVPGATPTPIEQRAVEMLARHFRRLTDQDVPVRVPVGDRPQASTIVLGTPATHPCVRTLAREGRVTLAGLGDEGYHVRLLGGGGGEFLVVAAETPRGVLYGAEALIEAMIAQQFGGSPVDMEFRVPPVQSLRLDGLNRRETPFYPVRATLEAEDPDLLVRLRVNVSGAEGVWTGTGIDDGLGAAFQYVLGFEKYQDRPAAERRVLIERLRRRTKALRERGIDSYLFFYVTGEPTKALAAARPDLFGPPVSYAASRDGESYRPFCWSNPDVRTLFAELVKEIVATYPDLTGFHLRAWGAETRASESVACGRNDPRGQELLWEIVESVIDVARRERPGFRVLLSGYDRSWLRDPGRRHLRRLPPNTILLRKWGSDGEPTADPGIPPDLLKDVAQAGHVMLILSHDVEEVQPLWMVESELFAKGVARYVDGPFSAGLGGYTLQGRVALATLDRRVSARINWNPRLPVRDFIVNALANRYGPEPAPYLADALLQNGRLLSDFFLDYGGILTVTGGYRHGSTSFATRLWDLFGEKAVEDILSLPTLDAVEYALKRLNELAEGQADAALAARRAILLAGDRADADMRDAVQIMDVWLDFFSARRFLVEAVREGYTSGDVAQIRRKLDDARARTRRLRARLDAIVHYDSLIQSSAETTRAHLLGRADAEIAYYDAIDAESIVRPAEERTAAFEERDAGPFAIENVLNAPSPVGEEGTFFIYTLTRSADSLVVDIYTAAGRRIRRLDGAPTGAGYEEAFWDARDEAGRLVANGVYFYRITARRGEEAKRVVGRFAVVR